MKALIAVSIVAIGLFGPAQASYMWTTLIDTAPRTLFDQIGDTAPRLAEATGEGVGELHPGFEKLYEVAP